MAPLFTVEQFYGIFRGYNTVARPAQRLLEAFTSQQRAVARKTAC